MKYILTLITIGLLTLGAQAITISSPLSYSTFGLVGTYDGKLDNASPATEITAGQAILDAVGLNTVSGPVHTNTYFDFAGTLTLTGATQGGTGVTTVPSGFDYALVKYDGQNAGYALFYFGGLGGTVPLDPANLWTTDPTQYDLSHVTVFNGSNEINPTDGGGNGVPDSGSTLTFLGMTLSGLGLLKRKLAK